jgi:hypothetical protein
MSQSQRRRVWAELCKRMNEWFAMTYDELYELVKRRWANVQREDDKELRPAQRLELIKFLIKDDVDKVFVDELDVYNVKLPKRTSEPHPLVQSAVRSMIKGNENDDYIQGED